MDTEAENNRSSEAALYLIPSPLGETSYQRTFPQYNRQLIRSIKHFVVEGRRSAVRFLKAMDNALDINSLDFKELSEHTGERDIVSYLKPVLRDKEPVGLITEAGCPCVADPGAALVRLAHKKGVKVIPLVGPSSILLSLMASGFNGQSFSFNGYLPVRGKEREECIRKAEARSWKENRTEIFIETPYRNIKLFESFLKVLKDDTEICVASNLTTGKEVITSRSVAEWKKTGVPDINKVPAIFLLYRGKL